MIGIVCQGFDVNGGWLCCLTEAGYRSVLSRRRKEDRKPIVLGGISNDAACKSEGGGGLDECGFDDSVQLLSPAAPHGSAVARQETTSGGDSDDDDDDSDVGPSSGHLGQLREERNACLSVVLAYECLRRSLLLVGVPLDIKASIVATIVANCLVAVAGTVFVDLPGGQPKCLVLGYRKAAVQALWNFCSPYLSWGVEKGGTCTLLSSAPTARTVEATVEKYNNARIVFATVEVLLLLLQRDGLLKTCGEPIREVGGVTGLLKDVKCLLLLEAEPCMEVLGSEIVIHATSPAEGLPPDCRGKEQPCSFGSPLRVVAFLDSPPRLASELETLMLRTGTCKSLSPLCAEVQSKVADLRYMLRDFSCEQETLGKLLECVRIIASPPDCYQKGSAGCPVFERGAEAQQLAHHSVHVVNVFNPPLSVLRDVAGHNVIDGICEVRETCTWTAGGGLDCVLTADSSNLNGNNTAASSCGISKSCAREYSRLCGAVSDGASAEVANAFEKVFAVCSERLRMAGALRCSPCELSCQSIQEARLRLQTRHPGGGKDKLVSGSTNQALVGDVKFLMQLVHARKLWKDSGPANCLEYLQDKLRNSGIAAASSSSGDCKRILFPETDRGCSEPLLRLTELLKVAISSPSNKLQQAAGSSDYVLGKTLEYVVLLIRRHISMLKFLNGAVGAAKIGIDDSTDDRSPNKLTGDSVSGVATTHDGVNSIGVLSGRKFCNGVLVLTPDAAVAMQMKAALEMGASIEGVSVVGCCAQDGGGKKTKGKALVKKQNKSVDEFVNGTSTVLIAPIADADAIIGDQYAIRTVVSVGCFEAPSWYLYRYGVAPAEWGCGSTFGSLGSYSATSDEVSSEEIRPNYAGEVFALAKNKDEEDRILKKEKEFQEFQRKLLDEGFHAGASLDCESNDIIGVVFPFFSVRCRLPTTVLYLRRSSSLKKDMGRRRLPRPDTEAEGVDRCVVTASCAVAPAERQKSNGRNGRKRLGKTCPSVILEGRSRFSDKSVADAAACFMRSWLQKSKVGGDGCATKVNNEGVENEAYIVQSCGDAPSWYNGTTQWDTSGEGGGRDLLEREFGLPHDIQGNASTACDDEWRIPDPRGLTLCRGATKEGDAGAPACYEPFVYLADCYMGVETLNPWPPMMCSLEMRELYGGKLPWSE